MKKLMLMRHATAGWTEPGMDDHDRTLNEEGRADAPVMARWLAAQALHPDHVLCSSALRTRETAEMMRGEVSEMPESEVSAALYHAGPRAIMDHLRQLPADCGSILLIGHEPGLGDLLRILDGQAKAGLRNAFSHFPTAAIAVLEVGVGDWADIGVQNVKFVAFKSPREPG
jgi:phosphohistidine phosphatase